MSIPNTAVSDAVAFIFAGMTSAITAAIDHDLWIEYGEPLADDEGEPIEVEPDDQIYLVEVANTTSSLAMVGTLGSGAMTESFRIEIAVKVQREEADATTAFDRCVSLINSAVAVVRGDPTLGGAVLSARPDSVKYPSPMSANNGTRRICETQLTFTCFVIS